MMLETIQALGNLLSTRTRVMTTNAAPMRAMRFTSVTNPTNTPDTTTINIRANQNVPPRLAYP